MSKKAFKRKESAEETIEEATVLSSLPQSLTEAGRNFLSLLAAHRWKALGTAAVAIAALTVVTGIVDLGKVAATVTQYATSSIAGSSTQAGSEAEVRSAVEVVDGLPASPEKRTASAKTAAPAVVAAPVMPADPSIAPCFTPAENCTAKVVAAIDAARSEILVQAYSLTAAGIVDALGNAKKRGVTVRVLLDKADERDSRSGGARLIAKKILPYVDAGVAIAHSKIIVIDRTTVITSSYNFNKKAQRDNAEDLLVIQGHPAVAAAYLKNWERRLTSSRPYYGTMAPVL
jgi:phosphatidylserine/phosphatidylglycerophosphate/cardiolipin synthase-like enzyme